MTESIHSSFNTFYLQYFNLRLIVALLGLIPHNNNILVLKFYSINMFWMLKKLQHFHWATFPSGYNKMNKICLQKKEVTISNHKHHHYVRYWIEIQSLKMSAQKLVLVVNHQSGVVRSQCSPNLIVEGKPQHLCHPILLSQPNIEETYPPKLPHNGITNLATRRRRD